MKKCLWPAWDSNPEPQNGRRRRIHWAMSAPLMCCKGTGFEFSHRQICVEHPITILFSFLFSVSIVKSFFLASLNSIDLGLSLMHKLIDGFCLWHRWRISGFQHQRTRFLTYPYLPISTYLFLPTHLSSYVPSYLHLSIFQATYLPLHIYNVDKVKTVSYEDLL